MKKAGSGKLVDFERIVRRYAEDIKAAAIKRAWECHEVQNDSPMTGPMRKYPYGEKAPEEYFADVPSLFDSFVTLPDSLGFDPMIESLGRALSLLRVNAASAIDVDGADHLAAAREEFAQLSMSGAIMTDWHGSAADVFKNDFLHPFSTYTQNQSLLIAALKSSAAAQQAVWENARTDILDIAKGALDALNWRGSPQNELVMVFTILSAIASLVDVPIAGAAVCMDIVGAASSIASAAVPMVVPGSDEISMARDSAAKIIDSLKFALDGARDRIEQAQQHISETLFRTNTTIGRDDVHKHLIARRPAMADNKEKLDDPG
jgi:hypothetical protein